MVIWVIYSKLDSKDSWTAARWKPFTTADLWTTYVLPGIQGTLTAAAMSIVLAGIFGMLLGRWDACRITAVSAGYAVSSSSSGLCPVLIMMIFAYFLYALYDVFPSTQLALVGRGHRPDLYNAAVIAEIVRAGVQSFPKAKARLRVRSV